MTRRATAIAFVAVTVLAVTADAPVADSEPVAQGEDVSAFVPRGGLDAAAGRALFRRRWVPAPASTSGTDGLGPLFNARACNECHRDAGRGRMVLDESGRQMMPGFVVRLGDAQGNPDPVYGRQVQTKAVPGLAPEAQVRIVWRSHDEVLGDGVVVKLRRPEAQLDELGYGLLATTTRMSLRLAPDLRVAGRIGEADLQSAARFGRKATGASLDEQTALAFALDLGLSTEAFPLVAGDCTSLQPQCLSAPQGAESGHAELPDAVVASLVKYLAGLEPPVAKAVPAADLDRGGKIFSEAGCAACHQPQVPGKHGEAVMLYSDLGVHDMGQGLADPVGTPGRLPEQWRTLPLVGVGDALAKGLPLLHDGRAETVTEAILWHGGEAAAAREAYRRMSADERRALEEFVASR